MAKVYLLFKKMYESTTDYNRTFISLDHCKSYIRYYILNSHDFERDKSFEYYYQIIKSKYYFVIEELDPDVFDEKGEIAEVDIEIDYYTLAEEVMDVFCN